MVYVTHQIEFLPAADLILVMKGARIARAGKYNDILSSGVDLAELVGAHQDALTTLDVIDVANGGDETFSSSLFSFVRASVSCGSCIQNSNSVVQQDAHGHIQSSYVFFDSNPSGSILNRKVGKVLSPMITEGMSSSRSVRKCNLAGLWKKLRGEPF